MHAPESFHIGSILSATHLPFAAVRQRGTDERNKQNAGEVGLPASRWDPLGLPSLAKRVGLRGLVHDIGAGHPAAFDGNARESPQRLAACPGGASGGIVPQLRFAVVVDKTGLEENGRFPFVLAALVVKGSTGKGTRAERPRLPD